VSLQKNIKIKATRFVLTTFVCLSCNRCFDWFLFCLLCTNKRREKRNQSKFIYTERDSKFGNTLLN